MRTFIIAVLLALFPVAALAAGSGYTPLAPIPGLPVSGTSSLADYINGLFNLIIGIAAILAVIRITIGGFQYMTTEAVSGKGEARLSIRDALLGLLLLLGTWLILFIINPTILNLDALNFGTLAPSAETQQAIEQNRADAVARQKKLDESIQHLVEDNELLQPFGVILEKKEGGRVEDLSNFTPLEVNEMKSACKASGRTAQIYDIIAADGTVIRQDMFCVISNPGT